MATEVITAIIQTIHEDMYLVSYKSSFNGSKRKVICGSSFFSLLSLLLLIIESILVIFLQ